MQFSTGGKVNTSKQGWAHRVGDYHSGLSLDGLHHEGGHIGVRLEVSFQSVEVVVRHELEAGHVWAKVVVALGVSGAGHRGQRAAPEVLVGEQNSRLVLLYAFHLVCPLSSQLHSSLASLNTGVHGQHLVVAEQLGDVLSIGTELVIVECS